MTRDRSGLVSRPKVTDAIFHAEPRDPAREIYIARGPAARPSGYPGARAVHCLRVNETNAFRGVIDTRAGRMNHPPAPVIYRSVVLTRSKSKCRAASTGRGFHFSENTYGPGAGETDLRYAPDDGVSCYVRATPGYKKIERGE